MREWPVPNRWTSPSAPIVSAHQALVCSIPSPWVAPMRASSACASTSQRGTAGAVALLATAGLTLVTVRAATADRRRTLRCGRDVRARLARPEVIEDDLRGSRADARHAERH